VSSITINLLLNVSLAVMEYVYELNRKYRISSCKPTNGRCDRFYIRENVLKTVYYVCSCSYNVLVSTAYVTKSYNYILELKRTKQVVVVVDYVEITKRFKLISVVENRETYRYLVTVRFRWKSPKNHS